MLIYVSCADIYQKINYNLHFVKQQKLKVLE